MSVAGMCILLLPPSTATGEGSSLLPLESVAKEERVQKNNPGTLGSVASPALTSHLGEDAQSTQLADSSCTKSWCLACDSGLVLSWDCSSFPLESSGSSRVIH